MKWILEKFGRKFITLIVGASLTVLNGKLGLGITEDQITNLLYLCIAYIGGQSLADGLSKGATSSKPKVVQ